MSFLKKVLDFEKFNAKKMLGQIKDDPERLFIGAVDPFSTKVWGSALGKDYEPIVTAFGGPPESTYEEAQAEGIDTGPGKTMHDIARSISSAYAGNYGVSKIPGSGSLAGKGIRIPNQAYSSADPRQFPREPEPLKPRATLASTNPIIDPGQDGVSMSLYDDYMKRNAGALSTIASNPEIVHGALTQQTPQGGWPSGALTPAPSERMSNIPQQPGALSPGTAVPQGPVAPALVPPRPQPSQAAQQNPVSAQDVFDAMPDAQKEQAVQELEAQGTNIDEAYRELMANLGEAPDTKLSKRDKGMLLMEFGLHMMAQSSAARHGEDFGGALGDAGLNALQSYRYLKAQKKADLATHQQRAASITQQYGEAKQAQAKGAREAETHQADIAKTRAETTRINAQARDEGKVAPNWITYNDDETGYSYAVDSTNPEKRIRLGKLTEEEKAGEQRPFEFQVKYDYYMNVHGKDRDGNPLTGAAQTQVAREALEFANRTEGMSRQEAIQYAREEARTSENEGLLMAKYPEIPDRSARIEQEMESLMQTLGFGAPTGSAQSMQDVTSLMSPEDINILPEGATQVNEANQILLKHGGKVYYLGQAPEDQPASGLTGEETGSLAIEPDMTLASETGVPITPEYEPIPIAATRRSGLSGLSEPHSLSLPKSGPARGMRKGAVTRTQEQASAEALKDAVSRGAGLQARHIEVLSKLTDTQLSQLGLSLSEIERLKVTVESLNNDNRINELTNRDSRLGSSQWGKGQ